MSKRQNPLYQGRDWFSYRWTVAQAFDALERIQDLCLCSRHEEQTLRAEEYSPLSSSLLDLSDLLGSQLAIVYGDVIPYGVPIAPTQQQWDCFEARQTFQTLQKSILDFIESRTNKAEGMVLHCLQLKEYLKKIDT